MNIYVPALNYRGRHLSSLRSCFVATTEAHPTNHPAR